jgi:hypothetical protein
LNKADAEALLARYSVKTTDLHEPGSPTEILVEILFDGEKVGEYNRDYILLDTFHPFVQLDPGSGKAETYALYSRNHTATRVMDLPSCEDLGGEEPRSGGFCPVEYYVPYDPERNMNGDFAFLSGCVWGDDSSWKLMYLDLKNAQHGEVNAFSKFGYLELPDLPLRNCIDLDIYNPQDPVVVIATRQQFNLDKDYVDYDSASDVDARECLYLVSEAEGLAQARPLCIYNDFYTAYAGARMRAEQWVQERVTGGRVRWDDDGRRWLVEDAGEAVGFQARVESVPIA